MFVFFNNSNFEHSSTNIPSQGILKAVSGETCHGGMPQAKTL